MVKSIHGKGLYAFLVKLEAMLNAGLPLIHFYPVLIHPAFLKVSSLFVNIIFVWVLLVEVIGIAQKMDGMYCAVQREAYS